MKKLIVTSTVLSTSNEHKAFLEHIILSAAWLNAHDETQRKSLIGNGRLSLLQIFFNGAEDYLNNMDADKAVRLHIEISEELDKVEVTSSSEWLEDPIIILTVTETA